MGGGSQGFSVECPATGELGHGKPVHVAEEVLASLLADEVAVNVPETRLGNREDKTIAVSKLWGAQSLDVPKLGTISASECTSDHFKAALREASSLLPFHSWLGTGDLKDAHVMVRGTDDGNYELASIDFAQAFGWDATGGNPAVPSGPPILVAADHRDPAVVRAAIERIEALSDDRIRSLVGSLPDDVLSEDGKKKIADGLIARRDKVRAVFEKAGWIEPQPVRGTHAKESN